MSISKQTVIWQKWWQTFESGNPKPDEVRQKPPYSGHVVRLCALLRKQQVIKKSHLQPTQLNVSTDLVQQPLSKSPKSVRLWKQPCYLQGLWTLQCQERQHNCNAVVAKIKAGQGHHSSIFSAWPNSYMNCPFLLASCFQVVSSNLLFLSKYPKLGSPSWSSTKPAPSEPTPPCLTRIGGDLYHRIGDPRHAIGSKNTIDLRPAKKQPFSFCSKVQKSWPMTLNKTF